MKAGHFKAHGVGFIDPATFRDEEAVEREYRRRYALAAYHRRRASVVVSASDGTGVCAVCATSAEVPAWAMRAKPLEAVLLWRDARAATLARMLGVDRVNKIALVKETTRRALLEQGCVRVVCDKHAMKLLWKKGRLTHGTYWAAYKKKCKCAECAEYRADSALRRREDRRARRASATAKRCSYWNFASPVSVKETQCSLDEGHEGPHDLQHSRFQIDRIAPNHALPPR